MEAILLVAEFHWRGMFGPLSFESMCSYAPAIQQTGIRFALMTSCFSAKTMHTGPLATSWMLGFQLKVGH